MTTPLAVFGPGILIVSRTDIVVPAPVNVGYAQEFSIDATASSKMLYGQNQWPLAVARGTIKGTGKFKAARFNGHRGNPTGLCCSRFAAARSLSAVYAGIADCRKSAHLSADRCSPSAEIAA